MLFDTASSTNPVLQDGVLSLTTVSSVENMFYRYRPPEIDLAGSYFLEARVKLVSGNWP